MAFHYPTTLRTKKLRRGKFAIVPHPLRLMSSIAAVLFLSLPTVTIAQELGGSDQINVGIAKSASPQVRRNAEAEKGLRVEPTRTFEYADHVANGVAMRNRTAGTIHLRGTPVPSKVLAALLYFNWVFAESSGRIWGMKAQESCAFLSDFGFQRGLRFGIRDG